MLLIITVYAGVQDDILTLKIIPKIKGSLIHQA